MPFDSCGRAPREEEQLMPWQRGLKLWAMRGPGLEPTVPEASTLLVLPGGKSSAAAISSYLRHPTTIFGFSGPCPSALCRGMFCLNPCKRILNP